MERNQGTCTRPKMLFPFSLTTQLLHAPEPHVLTADERREEMIYKVKCSVLIYFRTSQFCMQMRGNGRPETFPLQLEDL